MRKNEKKMKKIDNENYPTLTWPMIGIITTQVVAYSVMAILFIPFLPFAAFGMLKDKLIKTKQSPIKYRGMVRPLSPIKETVNKK